MQIRQLPPTTELAPDLQALLAQLRGQRRFDVQQVALAKLALLRAYWQQSGLRSAVVGVSGGIDSAVVALLLARLLREPQSPLQRLVLLALPCPNHVGVTGQTEALERATAVAMACNVSLTCVDMAPVMTPFHQGLETALNVAGTPWARGQAVSYVRTPLLYSATSLLAQQGLPGAVVGTTNRDEGAWLGYVGKAADGMVDIQPLSDLHKSEVYALARWLDAPDCVLDAVPTGDMFDGVTDEGVFGAPYDFVELALLWREQMTPAQRYQAKRGWGRGARHQFLVWMAALRRLHRYNRHKYAVASPAVHLDILPSAVPGGWQVRGQAGETARTVPPERRAGSIRLKTGDRHPWVHDQWVPLAGHVLENTSVGQEQIQGWRQVLTLTGQRALNAAMAMATWTGSGEYGRWRTWTPGQAVGSLRASFEDAALAQALWLRMQHHFARFRYWQGEPDTDIGRCPVWRAVGINPLFRAINYPPNGTLKAHYDEPFREAPGRRTLMSMVLVLQGGDGSGVDFLMDPQRALPFAQRNFTDAPAPTDTPWSQWTLGPGDLLVFDHRLRHAARLEQQARIILRSDILFESVLPP